MSILWRWIFWLHRQAHADLYDRLELAEAKLDLYRWRIEKLESIASDHKTPYT